jgi:hypothetical protein
VRVHRVPALGGILPRAARLNANPLGIRVIRRADSYLLVTSFSVLLAFGLWSSWQVRTGFIPEAPPEFLEIERHLRAFAVVLVAFSALGFGLALAVARGSQRGYRALAWLLTSAAVGAAIIRVIMAPRVVVDPDWPLVVVLIVAAAVCWYRALSVRTDA